MNPITALLAVLAGAAMTLTSMLLALQMTPVPMSFGAAGEGIQARVASSSTWTVGPQETKVWFYGNNSQTGSVCAARIISTTGNDIAITFSGTSSSTATSTLSSTVASGNIQLASTTVAYDGSVYGCGYLGFRGYGATSTIRIIETK